MEVKTVYLFDEVTGEHKGEYRAQACPMNPGKFIVPTHSTDVLPLAPRAGFADVWNGTERTYVPDHRGQTIYDQATGLPAECDYLGDLQAGWGMSPPFHVIKQNKLVQIDQKWAVANMSHFEYGSYLIGCDQIDRMNIDGVAGHIALFGTFPADFPGFWKAKDLAGQTALVPMNSVNDFRAMYAAMTARGSANFAHAQSLKATLADATTEAEIAAIVW
ncbi:DUF4376 domain-containing protein [Oxalicibacterium faecigallinarum]|uniref:DUF4376 domain-containing protein n=1 Tax=Oxalicibacterium faecigallinarum TaxID=573741 RepID=A0A8J3APL0_9BURK|nr:hypothetical protein [Oxalicibacterium faecigallinarum]GGI16464.1 hypothetical protein GCM10008066_04090 [Oxalicibacterium faecigallinarum]